MTQTLLLTLGRLPKALDIARAFHAAGWRVLVAEPFRWHLAGVSRAVAASLRVTPPCVDRAAYLRELADIVRREKVELIVPVSEETMHVAHLRGMLAAAVKIFTMPPAVVLDLHDKHRFVRRAAALGLDVPATAALGDPAGAVLAAAGDVVVKPVFSCSGRGVRILPRGAALPAPDPADPAIVQLFVAGQVFSTCSIAQQGKTIATIVYRGGIMSGTVAVSFQRVEGQAAIEQWVRHFVAELCYSGFISFDFVVAEDGSAVAIECNPRATSGLHFLHAADRVAAITAPETLAAARMRPQMHLQQFYASLTETQGSLRDRARFAANLRMLRAARDVTWSWRDPLPFVTMPLTSWKIIAMAIAHRRSFGEVAMLDVAWRDPPRAANLPPA
jgi:predicted ATP-grasp superfamily ATP-dependent carboligase